MAAPRHSFDGCEVTTRRMRHEPHLLGHDAPHLSGGRPSWLQAACREASRTSQAARRRTLYKLPRTWRGSSRYGKVTRPAEDASSAADSERDGIFVFAVRRRGGKTVQHTSSKGKNTSGRCNPSRLRGLC